MDRYKVIRKLAEQHNFQTGAELGVWVGVTTFHLMKHTDIKLIYAVDCWEEQPDNPEYHGITAQTKRNFVNKQYLTQIDCK